MSLSVNTTSGYKLTTEFIFSTTLTGENTLDLGDGNIVTLTSAQPYTHIYTQYGLYSARILDCNENEAQDINIVVKPHIVDSVTIEAPSGSEYVGKESGAFYVEVYSNCPPPLSVTLDVVGGNLPYRDKLPQDYKLDVTPQRYFVTDKTMVDNTVILSGDDIVEVNIGGKILGYKSGFCFRYYEDQAGTFDICATLERSCDLCEEQLRYYCCLDDYCFDGDEDCISERIGLSN